MGAVPIPDKSPLGNMPWSHIGQQYKQFGQTLLEPGKAAIGLGKKAGAQIADSAVKTAGVLEDSYDNKPLSLLGG